MFEPYPWSVGTGAAADISNPHLFGERIRGKGVSLRRLKAACESIQEARIDSYGSYIPAAWSVSDEVVGETLNYVKALIQNTTVVFGELLGVLK